MCSRIQTNKSIGGPCRQQTYDNEEAVRRMAAEQREMKIPSERIPHCPHCGRPMAMNLRADDSFVQDQGWYRAARRYEAFLERCQGRRLLLLELGVGMKALLTNLKEKKQTPENQVSAGRRQAV